MSPASWIFLVVLGMVGLGSLLALNQRAFEIAKGLDRRWIFLMMLLAVAIPILGQLTFPETPTGLARAVFEEIEHMVRQSVEGQALELGWVRDNLCEEVDEAGYLRMTLKKTCFYTSIHPCRLGALVARGVGADLDRFNRYGYYMGAAFQIQDDVLNLVGDMARYGKEIGGDIAEGKRTLMLIHLLRACPDGTRERLREFLATPRRGRTATDVRWVFEQMQRHGSIEHARTTARVLAGAALREYGVVYGSLPASPDRDFLRDVILYMIERDL